jgi:hypothetical protein
MKKLYKSRVYTIPKGGIPGSATPLSAGSNPACTSKEKWDSIRDPIFFFPLEAQA